MSQKQEKFVIVDGNALVHRAFHALPPLTTKKGELVNAVYGFTSILLKALKDIKPGYAVVVFDAPGPTFRHVAYEAYKATRKKQPDELYEQIPKVKNIVQAFGIPIFEEKGVEADDVIGSIAAYVRKNASDMKVVIVTGDMDALQLVDERTTVYTMKRGVKDTQEYDIAAVKERYGLTPSQMIDFKALRGDPSDNIPGVKGIGEKGATQLLSEYKTLEGIYKNISLIPERYAKKLIDQKEGAKMSRELATIRLDVPLKLVFSETKLQELKKDKIVPVFQKYEFKSLLSQLLTLSSAGQATLFPQSGSTTLTTSKKELKRKQNYILVDTDEKFHSFISLLKKQKIFSLDTETTGLNPFEDKLLGVSISWKAGKAYYILAQFLPQMKFLLEDGHIKKVGHNIKFDYEVLKTSGVEVCGIVFDTMIASYLLNPGSRAHGLDRVVFTEFCYEMQPITALIGKGKKQISLADVPVEKVAWYSAEDADYTWQLYKRLKPELQKKHVEKVFHDIDMPLVTVLASMERAGIQIDTNYLATMSKDFTRRIQKISERIYKLAGQEFNIASPSQLKEILFEKLKLSTYGIAKVKTGFSTGADELEKLHDAHPIIPLITEFREFSKLKSTYIDALPLLVCRTTQRVHTSFNQTIAATGRLSSSDPNLQNIPIRTDLGRTIRKAFIARSGYEIVSADYSQIELRIIAHLAHDTVMLDTFKRGEDIHTATAAAVRGISPDKVTKEMRRAAKSVNFGVLYGMGVYGVSRDAGISHEEAQAFLDQYFGLYKGVKAYLEKTIEEGTKLGYTETLFGRRRYLPELQSGIAQVRKAAERMATNMPVQGTEADLVKMAMIEVHNWIQKEYRNDDVQMLLQVHDELVFEVKHDLVHTFASKVKKIMEQVYTLKCPIVVDVHAGKNWDDMKEII